MCGMIKIHLLFYQVLLKIIFNITLLMEIQYCTKLSSD